jgi:hypothetical protein
MNPAINKLLPAKPQHDSSAPQQRRSKIGPSVRLLWSTAVLLTLLRASEGDSDPAMQPPAINTSPGPEYSDVRRQFQGIPGIERAANGRLWVVWYSGDVREGPQNYVVLATSDNGESTWSGPRVVIDPPGFVRAFDACLWVDPQRRLWLFWSQAAGHWDGRAGVWATMTSNAGSSHPKWSPPRRIADGVMMNKPIALKSGEWLLPIAVWTKSVNLPFINIRDKLNLSSGQVASLSHDLGSARGAGVYSSKDRGKTFTKVGQGGFPLAEQAHEHMLIERRNGSIRMFARTVYGIGSSDSMDGGKTWSLGHDSGISHLSTRFFIRRLHSGHLLLVKNSPENGKDRSHLTALLSVDDGNAWTGGLLLDERINVSYPDGVQAKSGAIHVVYDRERFTAREILMASFVEEDVLAGKCISNAARLKAIVNKAGPNKPLALPSMALHPFKRIPVTPRLIQ